MSHLWNFDSELAGISRRTICFNANRESAVWRKGRERGKGNSNDGNLSFPDVHEF